MRFGNLVGIIALLIAIYILWQIRFILLLTFAAVALATAINYLVIFLMRFRIRRGLAIFFALSLLLAIIVLFVFLIVPPFIEQVQQFFYLVPQAVEKLATGLGWLQRIVPEELVGEIQKLENLTRNLPALTTQLLTNFYGFFSSSLGAILNLLLVLVVTIMLLANPQSYRRLFIAFFPSFYRRRVAKILQECEVALVGWTKGILFNMSVITLLSWLGLSILQVPLPLTNALLAGLLTFIPNVGPVLSFIPPAVLALLETPWKAIAVLILYILIQQAESNILTPLVMKRQVSLLPAVTLLSQATFAVFFGFIGLFLALPLTVVAQVWIVELLIKDVLNNWHKKEKEHLQKMQHQPSQTQDESSKSSAPKVVITESP